MQLQTEGFVLSKPQGVVHGFVNVERNESRKAQIDFFKSKVSFRTLIFIDVINLFAIVNFLATVAIFIIAIAHYLLVVVSI
jgi:hypothetical protein